MGTAGSYGGKASPDDSVTRQPVVYIHGNSDTALTHSMTASGWSGSISYFLSKVHKTSELYATTWRDANALNAASP